jgi:AraC-like DNA-binding protein
MSNHGFIYDPAADITVESREWTHGRVDKISVSAPHQLQMKKNQHTLILFDGFQSKEKKACINGETWLDQKRKTGPRALGGIIDVIPYGHDFDAILHDEGKLNYTSIAINPALLSCLPSFTDVRPPVLTPSFNLRCHLLHQFGELLYHSNSEIHAEAMMMAILSGTYRITECIEPVSNIQKEALPSYIRDRLIDFIESNLGENITITMLSRLANLSPFHFSRAFKIHFGESPYRYVTHRRLFKARNLIINSKLTITEISAHCGFNTVTQLSNMFTRVMGYPPSTLRKK